ncbi:MAG: sugar phosphate nucleotidyltransferase [Oscillospiraceae bacterium]|nr:sugar phosphate nucleotidyltransferase [Oscillospiraceae bacterium]
MGFDATLVVMAAGMGSRFGGLKQVEPVGPNGEAILDFSVYDAKKVGFNKVVFVIKHQIENDFRELVGKRIEKKIDVEYVLQETDKLPVGYSCPEQRTKPWGTGHAVLCCSKAVKTPFAVINADDFYGYSAYSKIYKGLKNSRDYCMVGFRLGNTITENGFVSRGVCDINGEKLLGITERTKIDSKCRYSDESDNLIQLSADTVVSMNMWGFGVDAFKFFERDFKLFLDSNISSEKAEFYLPSVVDKLIKSGEKSVNVLVAEDKWYGVTYKEDKQGVVSTIKSLVDSGAYIGI